MNPTPPEPPPPGGGGPGGKSKAKKVMFYKSGDTNFAGLQLAVTQRRYRSFESLLNELSSKVQLPFGVRSIHTPGAIHHINEVEQLRDGQSYLLSSTKKAKPLDVAKVAKPKAWHNVRPLTPNRARILALRKQSAHSLPESRNFFVGVSPGAASAPPPDFKKPKKVTVCKNGEPDKKHVMLLNRRSAHSYEMLLQDISDMFKMQVHLLYTGDGQKVESLSAIFNWPDTTFIAAGREKFKPKHYGPVPNRAPLKHRTKPKKEEDVKPARKSKGKYKVLVTTDENPAAGTEATVSITVYGTRGNSGPLLLGGGDGNTFLPGNVDEFTITVGDVGRLYKIRIGHDNGVEFAAWLCDMVKLQDIHTGDELVFPCNRWMSKEEDDGEICREIPVMRHGEQLFPVYKYQVAVITGDYWNAGTEANIYITIYGERGDTGPRHLHRSKKSRMFEKGQTDIFSVEAVSLGAPQRIVIGHDNTEPGKGWYLEKVIIMESSDAHEEYVFPCHRWFDEGEDDGKTVRELFVESKPPPISASEKDMWAVEKWKYNKDNQIIFYCKATGKAVRIKADATVDANGEFDGKDPFSHFEVHRRKGTIRVFSSVLNPSLHLAVDHNKVLGQGKGGAYCEFRVRVQEDRSIVLESVKTPGQFVTFLASGKSHDTRGSSIGPSRQFITYVKGMMRDEGVVVLHTSKIQAFVVDESGQCNAHGKKCQRAYWRVHKADEGGVRMLESCAYPDKYLRIKDGQCDCRGTGDAYCQFIVSRHKDKGFITLQSFKNRGIYVGFAVDGTARPTVDTGERNVRFYPEVVEWGKKKGTDELPPPRSASPIIMDEKQKTTFRDGDWKIWLKSGKKGTKLPVTVIAYGKKGVSDLVTLGKPGDTLRGGEEEEFLVNLGSATDMYKIRLGISEDNASSANWQLSQVRMQDMTNNEQLKFKVNRWLSQSEDDGDTLRELAVVRPGRKPLPMLKYFVQVYTGDEPGADTDANVYICIYGDRGDTGRRLLHRSDNADKFQQAQVDSFEFEAVSLGKLHKVIISHDGKGPGAGWFCQQVAIRDKKDAKTEYVFPCNKWLDEGLDDKKIERELKMREEREILSNDWLVWVTTGSEDSASTTSKVIMFAYGSKSMSDPLVLGSGKDGCFYSGNTDEFKVNFGNIGDLFKIRIGHDNAYDEPGWYLDKVRMRDMNNGAMVALDVNRWLSREQDDLDVWRELPVALPGKDPMPVKKYWIQVFTGDLPKANTKAAISINIYGKKADCGKRVLYKSQNNDTQFAINQIDEFEIEAVHLGDLKKVVIGHDGKMPGEGWYLDKVIIKDAKDSDKEIYFPCKKWLDKGQDDKKIERELTPAKPSGEYTVWFTTGSESLSRDNALVYLEVYGEKGRTDPMILGATKKEYFSPGTTDQFEVNVGDIGDIYKIRVSHDDKDNWEGWYVQNIKMKDRLRKEEFVYNFDRWLSRSEDDLDIVRELATERPGKDPLPVLKYYVEVFTGSVEKADTSANIYMTIFGKKGDSGKRVLYKSKNNEEKFQREQRDVFEIEAVHLMDLKKIVIGHDGKIGGDGWYLEKVIIKEHEDAEDEWYFPCRKWLDSAKDDRKIEREIKASKPENEWTLWISTANDSSPRKEAPAHIVMYGDKGKTDMIPLGAVRPETLAPGETDQFEIQSGKIGKLYKIRIGYEDENAWDGWHVNEVKLRERGTTDIMTLPLNRWMSRSEDDLDVVRELPVDRKGKKPLPVIRYYVEVHTGDLDDADTECRVHMTIYGKRGDTGSRVLYQSKNNNNKFQRGQMDVFEIEAVHMGEIKSIVLGHDGVEPGEGWNVDHVVVKETEDAEKEWYFPCKRWFDVSKDDRKIEREIKPGAADITPPPTPPTPEPDDGWQLWIITADDSKPPNGAIAYITVYGQKNASERIPLSGADCFQPGKTDKFDINFEGNIGEPYKVRIEHDDRDKWDGWHVQEVKMRDNKKRDEYTYSVDRWLSRSEEDLDVVRELPTIIDGKDPLPVLKYYVEVFTGSIEKADTSANIYMTIFGKKGDSGKRVLYKSKNNEEKFQREQRDVFEIEAVHLMDLKKIVIGHDGKTPGKGWYLDKVIVKEAEDADKEFYFPCRNWLDAGQADNKVEREIKVGKPDNEWTVWISTASDSHPRNDAMAHLVVYGNKGKSDPILLGGARPNTLTADSKDEFEVYTGKVGKVYKIRVGYEDEKKWKGWHLNDVKMRDRSSHEELEFDFDRWMSRDEDDLDIVRELPAVRAGADTLPVFKYHVQVYTGEDDKASTNAKIYLEIHGERGDTGRRILYKAKNNEEKFQKGQVDIFEIEAVSLGDLKKVVVGHDKIVAGQGWQLEKIIIKEFEDSDKEWYFSCKRWLDAGKEDHKIERTLKPASPDGEWTLWITTSEDSKPRNESQVHVVVYGEKGKTDVIPLGVGKSEYFGPGTTNEEDINVGKIGKVYKIRIGHDHKDDWEGWHLQQVKMRERKSKEELVFDFDRWMSTTDDDLDVVREMPVIRSGQDTLPVMKYIVQVYTGTEDNADTEAACYLCIYGERGDTGNRVLFKSNNEQKFQKGQKDVFEIEAVHLGDLKKVVVGHNGKKAHEGWFIEKVLIKESEDTDKGWYFPCNRWLDVGKDDRKIERELKPTIPDDEWTLWITTAEDSKPRNESQVHVVVYGEKGKTDVIPLGVGKSEYFGPGTTSEEDIKVGNIGKVYKIRIGRELKDEWEGWHLDQVKMKERKTGQILEYKFDRWMSRNEEDLDIVRELPAIREGEDVLPVLKYYVQVYTGTEDNADTEATCYLCIYGERGDTGNRVLFKSNNEQKFQKGQKDVFEIEAVHLGDLKKVVVGHDGDKAGDGWFVEKVIISESEEAAEGTYFPCNRWFDVAQDDKKIERELTCGVPDGEWTLWITTSEDSKPRNESQVHVVVYGEKDKTDVIPLGIGKSEYFGPGTTNEEDINVGAIGKVYKIRIGRELKDEWEGWHLDQVKMKERKSGEILEYKFDRWMSRNEDDLDIVRELPAIREGEDVLPVLKYQVEVNTGEEENAETEATCYLCIYGERGDTGNRVLFKSNNEQKFQKGQKDVFEIEAVQLGDLKKVVIGHDGQEEGQGWYVRHVTIKESDDAKDGVFFPNDRWLDAGQDDKAIERELFPGQPEGEWDVTIVTAEDSIAAMDAVVYLVVYGDQGKSDPIPLGQGGTEFFEPGKTDLFERVKIGVGKVYKIRIGHNDSDNWEGWHLQEVQMKDRSTEEVLVYKFDRWISRKEDDLDILRELPAIREDEEQLPVLKYQVEVTTGEEENAETEATCYLCIYGERGDTGNRVLFKSNNEQKFQKGQKDVFEIEAVHLGDLKKVVIGHDGQEEGQGWYVSHVTIKESDDAKDEVFFPNDRWLDAGQDDKATERELFPGQPEGEWDVTIVTADDSIAAMDAVVYLVVYGDQGKSDPIPLGQGGTEFFEPGKTDLFERVKIGVGKVYKIRIGHNDSDNWEGWHLQEVQMKDRSTEEVLVYKFDRWMSRKEDDLDVLRELPAIREDEEQLPVFRYFISVFTGEEDNSDTEATLYMCIYGERGDTGNRVLYKSLTNDQKFQKGQLDVFQIEAVSLGELQKVVVGHDGQEAGQGWFCEKVIIKEAQDSEAEFHFPCQRWLDAGQDDNAIERELLLGKPPEGEWKLIITTHEDSIPPGEASAYLTVYGETGKTDPINIGGEPALGPGNLDEFDITLDNVGTVYKIRVEHDDKDEWEGWYLEEIQMTDKSSDEKYLYSFNRWMSRTRDDFDIARELPTIREGEDPLPVLKYQVLVYTGDRWAANTDAKLHITLHGERGDSGKRLLFYSGENEEKFQRKQLDTFVVEAVSLGQLTMAEISQDGIGYGAGVFIQKILVRESEDAEQEYVFWCDQWLDDHVDDRKTSKQLKLLGVRAVENEIDDEEKVKPQSEGKWKVSVKTSDKENAGTTSKVVITVYGDYGQTQPLPLETDEFKAADEQQFDIDVGEIGEISKIRLEHDNSGENPGWHVDKIKMEDQTSREELTFILNCWLSRDEEDSDVCKEVPAMKPGKDPLPLKTYIVEVQTADEEEASTDAKIFLTITGENGDTGKRQLFRTEPKKEDKKEDGDGKNDEEAPTDGNEGTDTEEKEEKKLFQQGQVDTFLIEAVSLGQLQKIVIGKDSEDTDSTWCVDNVVVKESSTAKTQYMFPFQAWIGKAEEDGNVFIEREVWGIERPVPPPESKEGDSEKTEDTSDADDGESGTKGQWHVWVRTGTEDKMGTTAKVSMVIYGDKGCSEVIPLMKEGEEDSESDKDKKPSNEEDDTEKVDEDKDKEIQYRLEAGSTQEFDIDVGDVGPLYKIRVFNDKSGDDPSWFLDKIKMKDKDTNQEFHFFANHWLKQDEEMKVGDSDDTKDDDDNKPDNPGQGNNRRSEKSQGKNNKEQDTEDEDDKKDKSDDSEDEMNDVMIELPAIRPDIPPPPVYNYEVSVYTGKKGAAATEADLHLTMFGEKGDTGQRNLIKSTNNPNKFELGQVDIFYISAVDLFRLKQITIGHSEQGYGAGWYLDKITVKETKKSDKMYYFPCQRWFDTGVDDRKTERQITLLGELPVPSEQPEDSTTPKSEGIWKVWIKTSDEPDAGTKAMVFLVVYGENAMSSQDSLGDGSMNSNLFDPGNEDEFDVNFGDIGKVSKIRLFHNNTNPDPRWKVDSVRMEDQDTGEKLEFNLDCWIGEEEDERWDGNIGKEAPAIREGEEPLKVRQYQVEVYTGEEDDSGTDATVFAILNGSIGDTGRRDLKKPTTENEQMFQKGQMDAFKLEVVDLGQLRSVVIGIDSDDADKKWYLEKVVIKDAEQEDAKETVLLCQQWIGEDETSRTLHPEAKWTCIVETSEDGESELNNAKVCLVAYEMTSDMTSNMSKTVTLDNGQDDMFTPGKKDEFEVNVGTIQFSQVHKIRVWLDDQSDESTGEKKSPSLHIKHITLKDEEDGEYKFDVNKWLSRTQEDSDIVREFPTIRENEEPLQVMSYHVSVHTSTEEDAATDSEVYMTIYGEKGDTGKRLLAKPINGETVFDQPGKVDEFTIEAVTLGELEKIVLWKSAGKPWFVDKVVIKESLAAQQETQISCDRILGKDNPEEPVEETFDSLEVKESDKIAEPLPEGEQPPESQGQWKLFVTTGEEEDAGTECKVTLTVYGSDGISDVIVVGEDKPDKFKPGTTDEFDVNVGQIGMIYKIRFELDGSEDNHAWYLDKIKMKDTDTLQEFNSKPKCWLRIDESLVQEIPAIWPEKKVLESIEYEIEVRTADIDNAGTDANVYITVYGEHGDTGKRRLDKPKDDDEEGDDDKKEENESDGQRGSGDGQEDGEGKGEMKFPQGKKRKFTMEAVDLGELSKAVIGHDGEGAEGGWFLDRVIIRNPEAEKSWAFKCSQWLSEVEDDNLKEREILASEDKPDPQEGDYKVVVTTKDGDDSGTTASVTMVVYGDEDKSDEIPLGDDSGQYFKAGATDEFDIHVDNIGKLYKVRIYHDNNGDSPGWYLDKVVLIDQMNHSEVTFSCDKWLSREQGDEEIVRELPAKHEEEEETPQVLTYEVIVHTGSQFSSGTDSNVYLNIYGDKGDTGKRELRKNKDGNDKFETGKEDTFMLEAVSLGPLQKVIVGHDGQGTGSGWYLDKIVIKQSDDETEHVFPCNKWLAEDEDDNLTERELEVQPPDGDGDGEEQPADDKPEDPPADDDDNDKDDDKDGVDDI
ncbi:uncharacterized protein LOC144445282 [Glandiceps talaboti]